MFSATRSAAWPRVASSRCEEKWGKTERKGQQAVHDQRTEENAYLQIFLRIAKWPSGVANSSVAASDLSQCLADGLKVTKSE